jgi:hypothetical protein
MSLKVLVRHCMVAPPGGRGIAARYRFISFCFAGPLA